MVIYVNSSQQTAIISDLCFTWQSNLEELLLQKPEVQILDRIISIILGFAELERSEWLLELLQPTRKLKNNHSINLW